MRDDDDWVGTPPEGRHGRERANPQFWRDNQRQLAVAGAILFFLILALVLVVSLQ
ncbi:MAG TPA: hypothetical protein VM266_10615 [Solirubrobacteraceae bacterium]|nr:hypothetical protein [Solirubrobacteraceae bacterium]